MIMPTADQVKAAAVEATVFTTGAAPEDWQRFERLARAMLLTALNPDLQAKALARLGFDEQRP